MWGREKVSKDEREGLLELLEEFILWVDFIDFGILEIIRKFYGYYLYYWII